MWPVVFVIPYLDFPISSFGVMMAAGFLVGTWITAIRMREEGLDPELATALLLYVMLGGVAGAKLYYAVDVHLREGLPFTSLLFARDGITWYGGLLAGFAAGAWGCRRTGVPIRAFMSCVAVALPVGHALGRIGCFLVGDDYGRPGDVPWALAFPRGAPPTLELVHPTQLYEVAWLLPLAALLWARRRRSPFLFGEYLVLSGIGRLWIEHWRVNARVALGLTEAQWIGVALILVGASGWLVLWRRAEAARAAR
jgi:phosphatidylglycerol:prolipoprotein diacylglycerol transferase